MGTLKGFPNPPAIWLRRAKPAYANAIMGTLKGFPNPPAIWLRRAKPACANAIMGTLKGFASPFGPPPTAPTPLASLGLVIPSRSRAKMLAFHLTGGGAASQDGQYPFATYAPGRLISI